MGRARRRAAALVALFAIAAVAGACGADRTPAGASAGTRDGGRLRIVTTVAPITSIVSAVVGDLADVKGLVPEGTNSHTYEPPPSAAAALARADLVFVNGLKLEDPTLELAEAGAADGSEIVRLGDRTITPDEYVFDESFPRDGGKPNPHLWTNPPMAKRYAEIVAEVVAERDPRHADRYRENLARFSATVDELDAALRVASATVPKRQLLTYHDAYAYFAREYGWQVIGAIQPSSFDEPTPKDVAALVRQVRELQVPAVFGSEVFPSPVLEQIGREAGVRYVDVLRDDDLPGRPGDPEHSWLGLMRFDFVTMVSALGGDASALRRVQLDGAVPDRAEYPQ